MMGFSQMIHPISVETFMATYWEKEPLHIPHNDRDYFASLFGLTDLEELFHNAHRRMKDEDMDSDVIYFYNKEQCPLNASPQYAYINDCNVVVNHADKCSRKVANWCSSLSSHFPYVYCNMYLTPPSSSAVRPHTDDREVLLFQIYGEKRWKVYGSPIHLPFRDEELGKTAPIHPDLMKEEDLLFDGVVKAGDVLYLPRGYIHCAETNADAPSLHFTMAIATSHWTFGNLLVDSLKSNILRRPMFSEYRHCVALPLDQRNPEYRDALQQKLVSALQEVTAVITANDALEVFQRHIQGMHNERRVTIQKWLDPITSPILPRMILSFAKKR
eukprot:PhF_6_TR14186/c0_g1_i1/m.22714/K16914/RIOX1, NO66; bifunctional lysine-specific demethylase and histidyl-hydroxylase NO66